VTGPSANESVEYQRGPGLTAPTKQGLLQEVGDYEIGTAHESQTRKHERSHAEQVIKTSLDHQTGKIVSDFAYARLPYGKRRPHREKFVLNKRAKILDLRCITRSSPSEFKPFER